MAQTITIDGVSRGGAIPRESIEWAESAYLGETAEGKLMVRDAAGSISVVGHKTIICNQSSSSPARVATQFVGPKTIKIKNAPFGAGREIEVATRDLNSLPARPVMHGASANRKTGETITVRTAYLLEAWLEPLGIFDFGRVQPSSIGVDKKNLQGTKPGDELSAMAKAARFNYYVRYNAGEDAFELVFRDDNQGTDDTWLALTDSCSIRLSNDPSDSIDHATVFAPLNDEVSFSENPDDVVSGAYAAYASSHVYRIRAATAAAFVARDGTTDDSGIKNEATAIRDAETFLDESDSEEQSIDLTLRMRASQLGLVLPGFRIKVKQMQLGLEGWASGDGRWARIARRRVSQPLKTDSDYNVALHLQPQEDGPARGAIVQRAFARGSSFGLTFGFPNPVTPGNQLVALIGAKLGTGDQPPPNNVSGLPRLGADAWTRVPALPQLTRAGQIPASPYTYNSCAAYWKDADSTEQECYFPINGGVVGLWELSDTDLASAVVAFEDFTTGGPDYTIGSLGSPAADDVALAIWVLGNMGASGGDWSWDYDNSYPWQTPSPDPGIADGWDIGISKWAGGDGWSRDAFLPGTPWVVIADAIGDGSPLAATVTPGQSGHVFGGIALVIPPA